MHDEMRKAGFTTFETLLFPQPCYPTGWLSCTLAKKSGGFAFREGDARAKRLDTKYYSVDIHCGVMTLSPFVAVAFGE